MKTTQEMEIDGKMVTVTINHGEQYWPFKIAQIERTKNARYVGEFAINQGSGWTESPVALFYQDKPPVEGYSHYFGILMRGENVYITCGQSAVDTEIIGIMSKEHEVIYSRFRHDYRLTEDGTCMIDGGRDYLKSNGAGRLVKMKIVEDELVIIGFTTLEDE